MNDREFEQYIKQLTRDLPKGQADLRAKKEAAWLKVQDAIRNARGADLPQTAGVFSVFRVHKLAWSALSILLVLGLAGGASQASKGSIPGDTLYPVKTAVEKVEKTLASSEEEKAQVLKNHAQSRLKEVEILVKEKKAEDKVVSQTLEKLKNTNQELHTVTAAVSEEQPELVDEVIELANQEQNLLGEVEKEVSNEKTRATIQELISISRAAVTKLEAGKGEVKAAQSDEDESAGSAPAAASQKSPAVEQESDQIESNIQIENVIKAENNPGTRQEEESPTILEEPTAR